MSSAFLYERGLLGVLWDYWSCRASLSELGFLGLGGFLGFCCCGLGGVVLVESVWPLPFAPVTLTLALSRRAGEGMCA